MSNETARRIRRDLKLKFPNADFSVRYIDIGIKIRWKDFPAENAVREIVGNNPGTPIFYDQILSSELIHQARERVPEHLLNDAPCVKQRCIKAAIDEIYNEQRDQHETKPVEPPRGFPQDINKRWGLYCIQGRKGGDVTIKRASEQQLKKRDD